MILYVLGPPGVGKTTLVRALLGEERQLVPSPTKWTIGQDHVAAGHYTGDTFDGGDTVGYSHARACLEYWNTTLRPLLDPTSLTILDGARFSTAPSLAYLGNVGARIGGVHLVASSESLKARCAARGSDQNESWMRGSATKASNFAKLIGACVIDADAPREAIIESVLRYVASMQCNT